MTEISLILFMVLIGFYYWKMLGKSRKVKSVKAQLVEKYTYTPVSRYNPNPIAYVIVFETDKGKRLSFDVSEFSYKGYKVKKRGTLKYKGNMILEFK
ncbi:MAG: DUF2500 family protein [Clostridia bacterium]|nr:DUF2500 family protein [Clostridia bacterium]